MFCHVQIFSTQMPDEEEEADDDDDAFAVAPLWPLVSMENEVQMTDPMLLHRGRDKKHWGFQTVSVNGGRTLFWAVNGSSQSCARCCYYAAISGGFCLLKLLLLCCCSQSKAPPLFTLTSPTPDAHLTVTAQANIRPAWWCDLWISWPCRVS